MAYVPITNLTSISHHHINGEYGKDYVPATNLTSSHQWVRRIQSGFKIILTLCFPMFSFKFLQI